MGQLWMFLQLFVSLQYSPYHHNEDANDLVAFHPLFWILHTKQNTKQLKSYTTYQKAPML